MKQKITTLHKFGALAAIIAGLAHVGYKTVSHGHVLPHVIMFASLGLLQIWWGVKFWKGQKSEYFLLLGAALNGSFIMLWALTRYIAPPFMQSPEAFEIIGWSVAILEAVTIWAIFREKTKDKKHWKYVLTELIIILSVGLYTSFALYGSGKIGEEFFPEMISSGHQHGGGHHH